MPCCLRLLGLWLPTRGDVILLGCRSYVGRRISCPLFQVTGEKRRRALERCHSVIKGWGLTMPEVEPLVHGLWLKLEDWFAGMDCHPEMFRAATKA